MNNLAGVKFNTKTNGNVRSVTFDMNHHANFIEKYLDHLTIERNKQGASFVEWDTLKAELDGKHNIVIAAKHTNKQ